MQHNTTNAVLSTQQMYRADALAIEGGKTGIALMENAGRAVAKCLMNRWFKKPVLILCGPGNNGGDGFVAAKHLKQAGWSVRLHCLVLIDSLNGDAAHHARAWQEELHGDIFPFDQIFLSDAPLVIDAIFGAGLTRPIKGQMDELFTSINETASGCLSVDLPSGVSGDSGEILGTALRAECTVTFFRQKPGHLLQPGAELCGDITVAEIGISSDVLGEIKPQTFHNSPNLWLSSFPVPGTSDHKYKRGHALIYGGDHMVGAARLAARAARRIGAGLSSIVCSPESFDIYAQADPGTIVETIKDVADLEELLSDSRRNVIAIGPGAGMITRTREYSLAALSTNKPTVLDADALSIFAKEPHTLFDALHPNCVLTPHDGEFARLFDTEGDKLLRTRKAALDSNAIVVLKGSDTIIASPDGRAAINNNAPPDLATAGAGDVLVGIISGLLAQGMDSFDTACAGVWIHGECANRLGAGLIAEDLCELLPEVIKEMRDLKKQS